LRESYQWLMRSCMRRFLDSVVLGSHAATERAVVVTLRLTVWRARILSRHPPVRFDERDVETEQGAASEAPADERAGNG
jgi:hypothetical protein